ncbi:GH92 family glycosyl hydrolase [Zunongwangia sp. HGR-M22]|uniref:GH92 family glycosyl hydrolase n=1 Tax=Zunongwangia sp. HGR-M22 TaxID=3015168 RepID=UPI0022DE6B13|nr:GH92 family glycosyl hydrolase [Zunongwangia sp. HGR-M22]WBL26408.1 GH92 family glycosyl hydrolase [Zunongwangia sp. HGR-M22]
MNFKNFRRILTVCLLLLLLSCKVSKTEKTASEEYVDKVYPLLDTENSRWFYFSSASRPFGMVNLSPDTQIDGAWGSGYRYNTDTVKGFSHIHAWQMAGLSMMPVIAKADDDKIFTDFYSKFDHKTEEIHPGYHKLFLDRYQIETELTSTTRVGFHKYNYQNSNSQALLFNLNTTLGPCDNAEGSLVLDSEKVVSGSFKMTPTSRRPKALITYFKVHFNKPVASIKKDNNTGNYLVTFEEDAGELMAKVGISYTSPENANLNIQSELNHWNFDKVVKESRDQWNKLLGRIRVEGGDKKQQNRFYTDLWHALQGRRIISDCNGDYPDNTGDNFRIGKLPLDKTGSPLFNHYNSDSFWGAQWTINTLWGLVYPGIMKEFIMSLLQYYKDGGYIPRGPSGGNYTHVMTGASSTPFIVSAIQRGLISEDLDKIYQALKLNHMPGGIMAKAGYEHETSIGGGLDYYLDKGYVPYPLLVPEDEYGIHKDGSSMTLEYAYQDYTLAQLAKKLEKLEDYTYFTKRSKNYKNVFNKNVGWMSPRKVDGSYSDNFDPYQYENGFVEANAAQATWFVPHDLKGLSLLMGGKKQAISKLNNQFIEAEKLGFTSGTSHDAELHPEYSRIPINYGNQPSIETAFVFTKLGNPELTQYWSRKIVNTVFSDLSPSRGYNGDEDQGLMGSLAVLMKLGLFQMNGGTEEDPAYQIGSPIFDKITIDLNSDFYEGKELSIISNNNSEKNIYIESAEFNNRKLDSLEIKHSDLIKGGEIRLHMTNSRHKK